MEPQYKISDILEALDKISGGRVIRRSETAFGQGSPFVVTKSSNLPGKAVTETPGLVCGDPEAPARKVAVSMTLTESQLELAGGVGVDAIVAHHPVADAASCGGVPLRGYAALYGVAIFELHEAFHGRHPGLAYLHGHAPFRVEISYGGQPGNVMFVGRALPEVRTLGDILDRLHRFCDTALEGVFLHKEREHRNCPELCEANTSVQPQIYLGSRPDPVNVVLHIFPHTGFTPEQLRRAKDEHPEIDTVLVSISRCRPDSPLVEAARQLDLRFLAGNSHALEIFENGMPLAYAIQKLMPGLEVVIFRERVTCLPVKRVGSPEIREYARRMAEKYLLPA